MEELFQRVTAVYKQYRDENAGDDNHIVGKQNSTLGKVTEILYHRAHNLDSMHYCDVYFDSGACVRIFNPDYINLTHP